jgi:hypothetical protein
MFSPLYRSGLGVRPVGTSCRAPHVTRELYQGKEYYTM